MAENGLSNGAQNPLDGDEPLHAHSTDPVTKRAHPQEEILNGDSATTQAEKIERHGLEEASANDDRTSDEPAAKRARLEIDDPQIAAEPPAPSEHVKGVAPIKPEFLLPRTQDRRQDATSHADDDAAEATGKQTNGREEKGGKKNKQKGGQNKARQFGSSRDALALCRAVTYSNEFSPEECPFGKTCKYEHNVRKYLKEGKRQDLSTLDGKCPVYAAKGSCGAGWRCRFVGSHSAERTTNDGRQELVLLDNANGASKNGRDEGDDNLVAVNVVSADKKISLRKKQVNFEKSDRLNAWMEKRQAWLDKNDADRRAGRSEANGEDAEKKERLEEERAQYVEPPLRPSEKRRIYYGPDTPILAPLTTQGNLPFRRLCVSLGAEVTWSEMAMGIPLLQGEKQEWALMKAHESETAPPKYDPASAPPGYDNAKDLKFGAQIAGNKPWLAMKTTEILTNWCPSLRAVDLNCGCPIDLVYRQGAGSALLDNQSKLEKILRGMNAVSGEVPITVKIRMGTRDNHPTADKLVQRLVLGKMEPHEFNEGPAGVAAITLHGRSRQQRYTRSADWSYISECAATINRLQSKKDTVTDTVREADARDSTASNNGQVYFVGNGDCYSHVDYYNHLDEAKVDGVMVARGALIKPWIFEEVASRQYLDKSASERLRYVEQFARNGLEYWGSDEIGVGTTRRFLLEWLSFTCRYVPIGLLEHLPPRLGDRPPAFKGRNDLETLLSSPNYKDWIKISEMFLGPAHEDFRFQPKHRSNSYEIEAEG